ncbi:hypothetical protein CARUB_v10001004mg [Capsella rubella]|uniref:Sugar phosphate transporter domain-containing protein n=2 Tax=Capsella rubella TaxID=81985 RepID=R0H751_9BRAS|nr:hypothetical protein CARUB_v10001004mg [Capsella rubella]
MTKIEAKIRTEARKRTKMVSVPTERRRELRKELRRSMIRKEDCFRRMSKEVEVVVVDFRRRIRNRNLGSSEGTLTSLKDLISLVSSFSLSLSLSFFLLFIRISIWTRKKKKPRSEKKNKQTKTMSSSSKKQTLFISTLIISWYSSNIGVLLLNKFLLSNYGFKFPIFLTMCHMSACAILSYISIVFLKLVPLQHLKSRSQFLKVATLSIVFCASVVGGNISLRYLPVSFNQAVGATTPFFTALFAYLMTFKREAWVTYGALVPVVAGVVIASGGEPGFHWFGFIMCISATAARAFKSVLQGILLSSEGEKLNSMNLMLYMSPIAVVALLPVTLFMEPDVISVTLTLAKQHQYMWILLLVNSVMAYSANLLNFLVTKHTSALTLQVLGNAKGAVAVVISILIFQNPVTVMGIGGYSITVLGVVAYGETKRRFR